MGIRPKKKRKRGIGLQLLSKGRNEGGDPAAENRGGEHFGDPQISRTGFPLIGRI